MFKLFEQLPELLRLCRELLVDQPLFLVLTVYAIRASALAFGQALAEALSGFGGQVTCGEMAIREGSARGLLVPTALYVRWQAA